MLTKRLNGVACGFVLLLATALASCSEEDDFTTGGEEVMTAVTLEVPDVFRTRAGGAVASEPSLDSDVFENATYLGHSGKPSIGNVDLNEHPITFTVGIYAQKKDNTYRQVDYQYKTEKNSAANFNFRLMKGQTYRIVAYANFGSDHQENLDNISISPKLNEELSDAFFASEDFTAQNNMTVVLKRPFGKLRLIARDVNTFKSSQCEIQSIKVTYGQGASALNTNSFNAITGMFNTVNGINHEFQAEPVYYQEEMEMTGDSYAAVFTMYLPANVGTPVQPNEEGYITPEGEQTPNPQSWPYPFEIEVTYKNGNGNSETRKRTFLSDIPVKRNWLTTIDVDHFWTENSSITLTIDSRFQGEIKRKPMIITVKTAKELQTAINNICNATPQGGHNVGKIVLGDNIDMSQDDDGCIMFDTYPDDLKKEVEIYLDLNGYKIISNGTTNPGEGNAKGILSIYSRNSILYIDDNSEEADGGVEYTGPTDQAYRLVTCCYGGQVVINRGNFVSTSMGELVWIYESESQHVMAEIKALNAIGITPDNSKEYSEKPTDEETLKKYNDVIKKLTSTGTINGGWFKGGFTGSSIDNQNVLVNTYNVKQKQWDQYCNYASNKGYPEWTQWGTYVNQTFSYVHMNGGSFVNLDPSRGDNIVGNRPEKWVNDKHSIVKETVNGQTVYTVVPNDSPEYYPRATGHN